MFRRESLTSGYLNLRQLSFVYLLICRMRNISPAEYKDGLVQGALNVLIDIERNYSEYWLDCEKQLFNLEKEMLHFSKEIKEIQTPLSAVDRSLIYLQNSTQKIDVISKQWHIKLKNAYDYLVNIKKNTINQVNPALKFLLTIQVHREIEKSNENIIIIDKNIRDYHKTLGGVVFLLTSSNIIEGPKEEDFKIIQCKICGIKLRMPKVKEKIIVICKQCGYEFVFDTRHDLFYKTEEAKVPISLRIKLFFFEG